MPDPVPAFVTQQLRCGAYWDAVPPFYAVNGLPPIPQSNYDAHTGPNYYPFNFQRGQDPPKFKALTPVTMPKLLALKFLWQVRSVVLKFKFENNKIESNGFKLSFPLNSDGQDFERIASTAPIALKSDLFNTLNTSEKWTTRDLKIPQGSITILQTPYSTNRIEAKDTAREKTGLVLYFNSSDYANYQTEKTKVIEAIDQQSAIEIAKLNLMKSYSDASNYKILSDEINRQKNELQIGVQKLKEKYQEKIDSIIATREAEEEPIINELLNISYGKLFESLKESAIQATKEEAQLQWFEFNKGFENNIAFWSMQQYLTNRPLSMHNPPHINGLFGGIFKSIDNNSENCTVSLRVPGEFYTDPRSDKFYLTKLIEYEVDSYSKTNYGNPNSEPVVEKTKYTTSTYTGYSIPFPLSSISGIPEYAGAFKFFHIEILGNFSSGSVYTDEIGDLTIFKNYEQLINPYNESQISQKPQFPTSDPEILSKIETLDEEQRSALFSGPYFSEQSWEAIAQELELAADKFSQLKEISETEQKGKIEFRDKSGNLLHEVPAYGKKLLPVKNYVLTIQIHELNTDPITETPTEELV